MKTSKRKRRMIFNNDGDDIWSVKSADPDELINQRTALLKGTHVDSIFYSTVRGSFGVFSHNTKIGTMRTNEIIIEGKIDPLQVMVDFARENDIEIFWSMRMNDVHDAWQPKIIPEFKKEHPEYLIGSVEKRPAYGEWTAVDYGHPKIRDLAFRYFKEVCQNYDIDGIELDFFRHPVLFKHKPGLPVSQEELDLMTELMVRIREMTDEVGIEKGHSILIAIRVPDSVEYCKAIGIDLERWLAEDLVDLLIVSGYFRINPWEYSVNLGHKYGVQVYASLDESRVKGNEKEPVRNSIQSYRARAMNAWDAGIDGIYMFNYFNQRGKAWKELGDPEVLKKLDKVYFPCVRWSRNGYYFPHYQLIDLPTINPTAPKVLIPDHTEVIRFRIGDDLSSAESLSELTLCLLVEGLKELSEIDVRLNSILLTESSINNNCVEYVLEPEHVKRGCNELEVAGLRGEPYIQLKDISLIVRYR
jgi:hypothetical protein